MARSDHKERIERIEAQQAEMRETGQATEPAIWRARTEGAPSRDRSGRNDRLIARMPGVYWMLAGFVPVAILSTVLALLSLHEAFADSWLRAELGTLMATIMGLVILFVLVVMALAALFDVSWPPAAMLPDRLVGLLIGAVAGVFLPGLTLDAVHEIYAPAETVMVEPEAPGIWERLTGEPPASDPPESPGFPDTWMGRDDAERQPRPAEPPFWAFWREG